MRFISSKVHGISDYTVSPIYILAPWLFGFYTGKVESNILIFIGVVSIIMSLFTNYELGLIKKLPFTGHLIIDIFAGLFLAASPWIFGFYEYIFLPHLIFGLFETSVSLLSSRKVSYTLKNA